MKLVIEIDEARFKDIQRIAGVQLKSNYFQTAEQIIASGSDVLDKIKDEIKALSNANPSYWHSGDMVDRDDVLEIIDKYRK